MNYILIGQISVLNCPYSTSLPHVQQQNPYAIGVPSCRLVGQGEYTQILRFLYSRPPTTVAAKYIERTSVVGSSDVESLGMHKKSIEAAKALKEEEDEEADDGGRCGGDGEVSSAAEHHHLHRQHQQPAPVSCSDSSTTAVGAGLDCCKSPLPPAVAPPNGVAETTGVAVDDALRSESIAALRAKVELNF